MRGEHVEAGRARAVPDRTSRGDHGRSGGDLGIGNAQQDRVEPGRVGATAERIRGIGPALA